MAIEQMNEEKGPGMYGLSRPSQGLGVQSVAKGTAVGEQYLPPRTPPTCQVTSPLMGLGKPLPDPYS